MARVVLQPSANHDARQHYVDTIKAPVVFGDFGHLIPDETALMLERSFPSGRAAMWGVTPGKGGINVRKYAKASVGDLVLFAGNGQLFGCGTIAIMFHNAQLASELWGRDAKGQTWEYMYALDEIRALHIPYAEFNRIVGYEPNFVIQGFNVMNEERSRSFLNFFGYWSERHDPEISDETLAEAISGLDGPLDTQVKAWARAEQARARRLLLGDATEGKCRLCGCTYTREFLVAAHKKKRAACTDEEKKDLRNVVMLACLFGCDGLYEHGYIGVDSDGRIVRSPALVQGSSAWTYATSRVLSRIELSAQELPYFRWHLANTFRGGA